MKLTSFTILLIVCFTCDVSLGQSPIPGSLPALSADAQPLPANSSDFPSPLVDMTTPTPSWQNGPVSPMSVMPFEVLPSVSQSGWFFRNESMFLHLSHGSVRPLVDDVINLSGPGSPPNLVEFGPVMTTNSISSDRFSPLPRTRIGYRFDDGTGIEAVYFGRNDWSGSSTAAASSTVAFVVSPDSLAANKATASLASLLNNVELNVSQPLGSLQNVEVLTGFRYFQFNEQFRFQTESVVNGSVYQSNNNVKTNNNLYGAQLGLRWVRQQERWSICCTGKTGVYANDTSQQQFFGYSANFGNIPSRDMSTSKGALSFIHEVGLNAVYQLTNSCSIRCGYNLFIIQGLSRASEQVDFSSNLTPSLYTSGTAVLHGPSAGMEFRF